MSEVSSLGHLQGVSVSNRIFQDRTRKRVITGIAMGYSSSTSLFDTAAVLLAPVYLYAFFFDGDMTQ